MNRARVVLLVLAFAMVGGLVAWRGRSPALPTAVWRWPEGRAVRYHFGLEGDSSIASPDGQGVLGGQVSMEGVLELARPEGATPTLVLRLISLDRASMTLFGAPAMEDLGGLRAALVGPAAVLTLFPTGDVKALAFSEGAPTLFETTAQTVVSELQHPLRPQTDYTLVETTTRGRAEARWRRTGTTLERSRAAYLSVSAVAGARAVEVRSASRFEFDDDGVLRRFDSDEVLTGRPPDEATRSRLTLTLTPLSVEARAVRPPERTTPAPLGALKPPRDAEAQLLAQRIAGLDGRGLVKGLGDFSLSTGEGGLGAFMARASGLLLQQPELASDVVAWARGEGRSARDRQFALEVLAAAGTPRAQAAMLELLGDAATAAEVQRLSLVQQPTVETARFVEERWRRSTGEARETVSLTLGAVSGQLARSGHEAEAHPMGAALLAALGSASTTRERVALTFALGNAGLAAHVGTVLSLTADDDESVRIAALHALRKTPVPEAHLALQRALADQSPDVAREAVSTLGRLPTTPADHAALMAALRAGTVPLTAAPLVVNVLEPHLDRDPAVRPFLAWLSTVENLDTPVRRRLATLLDPESNR